MEVSLREIFTPLITYTLLFARTPAYWQRSFAEVRREMERLLDEQRTLVKRHDVPAEDYQVACFAVLAWIDELVLTCTHDSSSDIYTQWKRAPLQVERFNTANAGEEFFDQLERLSPSQKEICEIYHLCLCLGFRGRYYDDTQEYKLAALRREYAQRLPTPFPELLEVEKRKERVTPQPYAVQPPPAKPIPRSLGVVWAALALLLLAGLFVYAFWPRPGALPDRDTIIANVQKRIQPFECCDVTVTGFQDGVVSLQGSVESEEQGGQMRTAAAAVPGVKGVQDAFTMIPRPFCAVVELLTPFRQRGEEVGFGLRGEPQRGCGAVYSLGENLVIDVSAQKPMQYVYVDYYVADRQFVAHVVPNPRQPDNFLQGATGLTIGAPGAEPRWQIQPPFGLELVTVIASPGELFERGRLQPEPAATYLEELRRALPADSGSADVVATYCFITSAGQ